MSEDKIRAWLWVDILPFDYKYGCNLL